jgi:hypothetical protein
VRRPPIFLFEEGRRLAYSEKPQAAAQRQALAGFMVFFTGISILLFALALYVGVAEMTDRVGRRAMLKELADSACPYCDEAVGNSLAVDALKESEQRQAERGYISENGFRVTCRSCRQEFLFRDGDRAVAPLKEAAKAADQRG